MSINHFIKICILFLAFSANAHAKSILWEETTIPMAEAGSKGLETLLVWPNTPGKHPLALISHGSPRDAKQRSKMSAISELEVAMQFARRGFAVAVVMRRGYGNSGGKWVEGYNSCKNANYEHAATESVKDLHAAIQYLSTLPQFDTDHIIAVGVSAGGFASLALAAESPPKGLMAVINFAGVRGSISNDTYCKFDSLIATFGDFGKTARVPMLWIYAENDHFANAKTAQKLLDAFKANGGNVTFIKAPAFGQEGHFLFGTAGIPLWTPYVDKFLKAKNLTVLKKLLPEPETVKLDPPKQLIQKNMQGFTTYLTAPLHKAFAIDAAGAYGFSTGHRTINEAKKSALDYCHKFSKKHCEIYAVDDDYAN